MDRGILREKRKTRVKRNTDINKHGCYLHRRVFRHGTKKGDKLANGNFIPPNL
jgi:hypothetical protein